MSGSRGLVSGQPHLSSATMMPAGIRPLASAQPSEGRMETLTCHQQLHRVAGLGHEVRGPLGAVATAVVSSVLGPHEGQRQVGGLRVARGAESHHGLGLGSAQQLEDNVGHSTLAAQEGIAARAHRPRPQGPELRLGRRPCAGDGRKDLAAAPPPSTRPSRITGAPRLMESPRAGGASPGGDTGQRPRAGTWPGDSG